MRYLLLSIPLLAVMSAQEPVAPTTGDPVGSPRGENAGDYNVVQSWELGYRYSLVGGDVEKYQSDVNFGNGIRLLSSFLSVNSREGQGKWFDEIVLTTQGLGNDPYESALLRIRKNRLYRYDMHWRENVYFDPGLATSAGLHLQNLTQRYQDHDLVLFPTRHLQFKAGFSANSENGPALSTINLFESQLGDIFTLFSNVKRTYKAYRVGADFDFSGIRLSVLHRWEFFDDYTPYNAGAEAGLNATDRTTLTGFNRVQPLRGSFPGWLVNLAAERRHVAVNGRFSYADGRGNFILDETAAGTGLAGTENRLVFATGDGQRPVGAGDLNVSYFPGDRVTITNSTSVSDSRVSGNNYYEELDLGNLTSAVVNFQFLGIRLITNSTDAHYHASKKLDLFAGFRYADRQIRSIQSTSSPGIPFANTLYSQYDLVHAGVAGLNWKIANPLQLHLSAEIGRNDNPFFPVSEKNYQALDARVQYRHKSLAASGGYKEYYNNNPVALTSYNAHSRTYFANASWVAASWFAIDASYTKLHLDTAGGVAFFAASALETGESIYISNIHAANLGARIALRKRADLYLGYALTRDTGDGRSGLEAAGTAGALLYNVQTFPLTYESPLARISIRINSKVRWNAGYQYYGYREALALYPILQNYHAHTGYTSVLWSF
jgi:hypothetical protein